MADVNWNESNTKALTDEMKRLTEEQNRESERAVYITMVPREAREYDKRRLRLMKIHDELNLTSSF